MRHPQDNRSTLPPSGCSTEPSRGAGTRTAFFCSLAVTLLIAWPVVLAPTQRIFGTEIVGRHHDPFTVMWQFENGSPSLPYRQPLVDDAGRALASAIGAVAAFNVIVLITFPLTAAAAYGLARFLGLSHGGALVAALAFAFAPVHLAHAAYHPHIAQTQWIPLALLALWAAVDRPTIVRAALLAAAFAGLALSNLYGAFIGAVVAPIALTLYWMVSPRIPRSSARRVRSILVPGAVLAVIGGAAVVLIALTEPALLSGSGPFAFPRTDAARHGARWWAYLVPPADHPLFGSMARRVWNDAGMAGVMLEQQVSLGWSLLALGGVAVWTWTRRAFDRDMTTLQTAAPVRAVPVLVLVAVWAAVCSLPPDAAVPAPGGWLHSLAPMFRSYARFGVVTQLMIVLLAGIGLMCLMQAGTLSHSTGARNTFATATARVLLLFAVVEYAPLPWRTRDVLPTQAHRWLAQYPQPIRVLDCVPWEPAIASVPWLMRRDVTFQSTTQPPCEDQALPHQLAALDYTHMILRPTSHTLPRLAGLTLVQSFGGAHVLAITADKAPIVVVDARGFYEPEANGRARWRWMDRKGNWIIRNAMDRPLVVIPELELAAFAEARHAVFSLDGRLLETLPVARERRRYRLTPFTLGPGDHELALEALEPGTIADEVESNGDPRRLTIAAGQFRWLAPIDMTDVHGFFDPEIENGRAWRWMGQSGQWVVQHRSAATTAVLLDVELAAFPHPRRLAIALDGRLLETLSVELTPRRYRIGPFVLSTGVHHLTFETHDAAVVADDVLRNGDRRALAIMAGDSRWEMAPLRRHPVEVRAANDER